MRPCKKYLIIVCNKTIAFQGSLQNHSFLHSLPFGNEKFYSVFHVYGLLYSFSASFSVDVYSFAIESLLFKQEKAILLAKTSFVLSILPDAYNAILRKTFISVRTRFKSIRRNQYETYSEKDTAISTESFSKMLQLHGSLSARSGSLVKLPHAPYRAVLLHLYILILRCQCTFYSCGLPHHHYCT